MVHGDINYWDGESGGKKRIRIQSSFLACNFDMVELPVSHSSDNVKQTFGIV